jgi:hypothetical protein
MTALRLTGLLAVAAAAVLLPVSPAHASGLPPVPQPDAVTVTIDSREVHIDVAANDYDPEGEKIVFAGTDGVLPPGVGILADRKDVLVYASSFPAPGGTTGATPGTYVVKTYVHDGINLAATTLTLTVLPSPGDVVDVATKRPGRVRVLNGNDVPIRFMWGAEGHKHPDGRVDVPAHSSRTIRIERRSLVTVVLAGTDFALGIERHLQPPRNGTALPPGVAPGHDTFAVYNVKWVRKAISL